MRRLLLFFVYLLFFVSTVRAGSMFPYAYQEHTMDNGLKVILIPIKNQGLVSFFTIVHTGSRDEIEPGKSGFAHFFEHMMFRGTEKYPSALYDEITAEMGAERNAYTTDDYTFYYMHFPDRYLEKVIDLESNRFQNLKYALPEFQTEAKAVLGEYNKNFANPFFQIEEKLYDNAFSKSSYKHTTMGFLKDIQDMPNQYDYSLSFFNRFYRPNNCTILVTGNFNPETTLSLIKKYYTAWKPNDYKTVNAEEPEQTEPKSGHVDYTGDTLPLLVIGYKSPAFDPANRDFAALDVLTDLAFGETSPLYQKLVLEEQKVDMVTADFTPHRDPNLFIIYARLKKQEDLKSVEDAILATLEDIKKNPVEAQKLADLKSNFKYSFLMGLDTSKNVGFNLGQFVELTRDIQGVDQMIESYQAVTAEDVQKAAQKYFMTEKKTTVTLTGGK